MVSGVFGMQSEAVACAGDGIAAPGPPQAQDFSLVAGRWRGEKAEQWSQTASAEG